nr:hypothetical protein [uncultured Campylobacter sp.]
MKKLAIKIYDTSAAPQGWVLLIRGVKRILAALALVLVFATFQNLANL